MLLTLTASCVRSLLSLPGSRPKPGQFDLLDLPSFTQETLGLSGLTLTTDLLAGADRARLEQIRERADKARCACLLLAEPDPLHFGSKDAAPGTAASQRLVRVVEAAHILGCSAAAFKVKAPDDDEALARVAQRLRAAVERAEKLDLNILVSPCDGLTSRPERVTELLKKIGGFRVGTYPDFLAATQTKDPVAYLHRLAPYATVVCGTTIQFEASPETEEPASEPKAERAGGQGQVEGEIGEGRGDAAAGCREEEARQGGRARRARGGRGVRGRRRIAARGRPERPARRRPGRG